MAEMTNHYECMFILDTSLGEENVNALKDKFKELIEQNATLDSIEEWGNRRLSFPINDLTEGYYVLTYFTSKPDFPAELERVFKITDGVIRSMVIRKDK